MSGVHVITEDEIERLAREVWGDKFKRAEFKPRKRRSERIVLHVTGGTLTFTHDSYADPDAVRKAVIQFFADCRNTANETVRKLLESDGGDDGA